MRANFKIKVRKELALLGIHIFLVLLLIIIYAKMMYNPKIERCTTVSQKNIKINNSDTQTTTGDIVISGFNYRGLIFLRECCKPTCTRAHGYREHLNVTK